MIPAMFLMDKMGNDTGGITALMVALIVLVTALWLGGLAVRFIRRKRQRSN